MKPDTPERLSAGELEDLKKLKEDLRGLRKRWIGLVARLARARRSTVTDRLACVLHDCLTPALRDLESIAAEAREHAHPAKRRRADGNRTTARHSR